MRLRHESPCFTEKLRGYGRDAGAEKLVPKGGLEPPHPCEYMDLNHARLPIPPLRHYGRELKNNRSPEP